MNDSKFNCIAIFDAIPKDELNTAGRLREELHTISYVKAKNLQVRYFEIIEESDIRTSIDDLLGEVQKGDLIPWIHLEGHGLDNKSGFCTQNRNPLSWKRFRELITPLNIKTELNLVVVLASCFGANFAKALEVTDRAPVLALVGPIREVKAGQLEMDFKSFYKALFEDFSLGRAVNSLGKDSRRDLYYATDANMFFYDVWKNYKSEHCTNTALKGRALTVYHTG